MMANLTRIIELFSSLLVVMGFPAASATMYALIFIYLFVTALIAGLLFFILKRRQLQEKKSVISPPDQEG